MVKTKQLLELYDEREKLFQSLGNGDEKEGRVKYMYWIMGKEFDGMKEFDIKIKQIDDTIMELENE